MFTQALQLPGRGVLSELLFQVMFLPKESHQVHSIREELNVYRWATLASLLALLKKRNILLLERQIELLPASPGFLQADRVAKSSCGGSRANGDGWAPTTSPFLMRGRRAGGVQCETRAPQCHRGSMKLLPSPQVTVFVPPSLGAEHSRSACKEALLTGKEKSPTLSSSGSLSSDSSILDIVWKSFCIQSSPHQGKSKKKQKQHQPGKVSNLFIACTSIQNLSHYLYKSL